MPRAADELGQGRRRRRGEGERRREVGEKDRRHCLEQHLARTRIKARIPTGDGREVERKKGGGRGEELFGRGSSHKKKQGLSRGCHALTYQVARKDEKGGEEGETRRKGFGGLGNRRQFLGVNREPNVAGRN